MPCIDKGESVVSDVGLTLNLLSAWVHLGCLLRNILDILSFSLKLSFSKTISLTRFLKPICSSAFCLMSSVDFCLVLRVKDSLTFNSILNFEQN